MKLVSQDIIKKTDKRYKEIYDLCHKSKNLFNATLYAVRQHYFETKKYLPYARVDLLFKQENNPDYRALPSQTAQQTMRTVDSSFKSFFRSLKNPGKHRIPRYKDKDGTYIVTYTGQQVRKKVLKCGILSLPGLSCVFKTQHENINQVRFIPKDDYIVMETVYNVTEKQLKEDNHRYAAIDIGIDNLAALSFSTESTPILINGRPVKSINQYYNKKRAEFQSKKQKKKAHKLALKRNNKIKDYFHKSSRFIVNQLASMTINTLIVGHNKGWKQDTNIGRINNQSFCSIPHNMFINMLRYKCQLEGIRFVLRDESWTSKSSALEQDPIPATHKAKEPVFSGKRVHRGLYQSKSGLLNADVNGSLNILRKEVGDVQDLKFLEPANRGFVFNPSKISF